MALISRLAARVGSSGFVLEVLGGVCTRPAQGDKPCSNAMACFQAALQGSSTVTHPHPDAAPRSAAHGPTFSHFKLSLEMAWASCRPGVLTRRAT